MTFRPACALVAAAAALALPAAAHAAYAPQLQITLSDTTAGATPALSVLITQAAGETPSRTVVLRFPSGFGVPPEPPQIGQCTATQEQAHACPADSQIGDAYAQTGLGSMSGPIYYGQPDPLPKLVVGLSNGLVSYWLDGTISFGSAGITTTFDNLPNLSISQFWATLEGGSKALFSNPTTCGAVTFTGDFTSQSGQQATATDSRTTITGCPSGGTGSTGTGGSTGSTGGATGTTGTQSGGSGGTTSGDSGGTTSGDSGGSKSGDSGDSAGGDSGGSKSGGSGDAGGSAGGGATPAATDLANALGAPSADPGRAVVRGAPAALQVSRARVRQGRLVVRGALSRRADGDLVGVGYSAPGGEARFLTRVRHGRLRLRAKLPRRLRHAGAGVVTVLYPGGEDVRSALAQVRAGRRVARLRVRHATLRGRRLRASGRVARHARGRVAVALSWDGGRWTGRAPIRHGRWRLAGRVPRVARRGAYLTVAYAGTRRRGMAGAQAGRHVRAR